MKKFLAFVLCAAVSLTAAFAGETVLEEEDFYGNDWIVGEWTLDMTVESAGELATETLAVSILGNEADSVVVVDGEELDLETFVYILNNVLGIDADTLYMYELYGMLEREGDLSYRLNDAKNEVKMEILISMYGEVIHVLVKMTK